jgi:integrase
MLCGLSRAQETRHMLDADNALPQPSTAAPARNGLARKHRPPLSAVKVAKLKEPGRYGDGGNLWLQVTNTSRKDDDGAPIVTKSWVFRYKLNGKARAMGLGPLELVSLAEARDLAQEARKLLLKGKDPIEERDKARDAATEAKRIEAARSVTFKHCAEKYLAAHQGSWKNDKHRAQWGSTLSVYAYPEIGALPVSAVDTALVLRILEPIWSTKRETASRLRGRIEVILDWARVAGYRQGENPARWRGHLDHLLARKSKRSTRHHPAMAYKDLPAFMQELRTRDSISARALEFTILTAARTGEAIEAKRSEVDREARVWTVPAERMKAGRGHRVPLSDRAFAILEALPEIEGCPYLFPSSALFPDGSTRPLSNMAMLELLRGMRPGLTVHGFRASFKDWAREQTDHPRDIVEAALAHVIGDKAEAAYVRGDAIAKRRALMDDWAAYCGSGAERALGP